MSQYSNNDARFNLKTLENLQASLKDLFASVSEVEWMQNTELKSQTIKLKELAKIINVPKFKGGEL